MSIRPPAIVVCAIFTSHMSLAARSSGSILCQRCSTFFSLIPSPPSRQRDLAVEVQQRVSIDVLCDLYKILFIENIPRCFPS